MLSTAFSFLFVKSLLLALNVMIKKGLDFCPSFKLDKRRDRDREREKEREREREGETKEFDYEFPLIITTPHLSQIALKTNPRHLLSENPFLMA